MNKMAISKMKRVSVGRLEVGIYFGKFTCRQENNIRMCFKEKYWETVEWTRLAYVKTWEQTTLIKLMKFQVAQNAGKLLSG